MSNELTPAERERLTVLAEECSEIIQAVAKTLRHGWRPVVGPVTYANREHLEQELGHLKCIVSRCISHGDINIRQVNFECAKKEETIDAFLHHQ